jgi:dTDP-4-amino-4,6-dideoxygalactose transaminase
MKSITDYKSPFDAILEFESAVAQYTGAPYCVSTDCCTHAIEIALRLVKPTTTLSFPAYTYLSVPMTMHKLGINYTLLDQSWKHSYQFVGSDVWDCARQFDSGMYQSGSIQCISFGRTKPLEIGKGGCILTDSIEIYQKASRMRYDGRDIFSYSPWDTQTHFTVGYHYYMRPEECVTGLNLLHENKIRPQQDKDFNYPDCRKIQINE